MRYHFSNIQGITFQKKILISEIFDSVATRGAFILQQEVAQFEYDLARYIGVEKSIGVGNATDGLEIALGALNIGAGDEVIISAHTMIATASAVVAAGATPVPVDIGPDWMIDPDMVENSITERTVGIMPTQLNGRTLQHATDYGYCRAAWSIRSRRCGPSLGF